MSGADRDDADAFGNRQSAIGNRDFEIDETAAAVGFAEGDPQRSIRDHRDLDVWKVSMTLALDIYRLTKAFPSDERFGLISQMRRAAISVPTNIAEGYGRESKGAYLQFLRISQGSVRELETQIDLAAQLGYLKEQDANGLSATVLRVLMMLRRLIQSLEKWREK